MCASLLVGGVPLRYQTNTEHISDPNSEPPMRETFICGNGECQLFGSENSFWTYEGEFFGRSLPDSIVGSCEALGSFAMKLYQEVYSTKSYWLKLELLGIGAQRFKRDIGVDIEHIADEYGRKRFGRLKFKYKRRVDGDWVGYTPFLVGLVQDFRYKRQNTRIARGFVFNCTYRPEREKLVSVYKRLYYRQYEKYLQEISEKAL